MYLRFERLRPLDDCVECALLRPEGLFCGVDYAALRDGAPVWLIAEIDENLDWFNANLAIPRRLFMRERRERARRRAQGYCWFRPEAREAIARARHLAWALGEAGEPFRSTTSAAPGEILWEDAHQIVAVQTLRHVRGWRPNRPRAAGA